MAGEKTVVGYAASGPDLVFELSGLPKANDLGREVPKAVKLRSF